MGQEAGDYKGGGVVGREWARLGENESEEMCRLVKGVASEASLRPDCRSAEHSPEWWRWRSERKTRRTVSAVRLMHLASDSTQRAAGFKLASGDGVGGNNRQLRKKGKNEREDKKRWAWTKHKERKDCLLKSAIFIFYFFFCVSFVFFFFSPLNAPSTDLSATRADEGVESSRVQNWLMYCLLTVKPCTASKVVAGTCPCEAPEPRCALGFDT